MPQTSTTGVPSEPAADAPLTEAVAIPDDGADQPPLSEPAADTQPAALHSPNHKEALSMLDQTEDKDIAGFDVFSAAPVDESETLLLGNALRDLVREVVLQEFQGETGARISQNLRRAVRQEVAAAIAAGLKA